MAKKAVNKTQATEVSVADFLGRIDDAERRADCDALVTMMGRLAGAPAVMWGPSIVGFGRCHYRYESGREGDMPLIGFSPRKPDIVLYIVPSFDGFDDLLAKVGKVKTSKVCLYVRRLSDVDLAVIEQMIVRTIAAMAPQRVA